MSMLPLLLVALLVWGGVFAFIFSVDVRVKRLENKLAGRTNGRTNPMSEDAS